MPTVRETCDASQVACAQAVRDRGDVITGYVFHPDGTVTIVAERRAEA